jgi:hypothetical protein
MLRKIRERVIRILSESDTVYLGKGVYKWINFEEKILIRSDQRVVSFGPAATFKLTDFKNTIWVEKGWDEWETWLSRNSSAFIPALEEDLKKAHVMPEINDLDNIRETEIKRKNWERIRE